MQALAIFLFWWVKVDIGFSRLRGQVPYLQGIGLSVLYEVGPTLPEFKWDLMADTLFSNRQYPVIVQRPGVSVRFAAHNDEFNTGKVFFQINRGNHRLADDVFVMDGKFGEDRQTFLGPLLILYRAAHSDIVVTASPVGGNAVQESLNSLGEKKKLAKRTMSWCRNFGRRQQSPNVKKVKVTSSMAFPLG